VNNQYINSLLGDGEKIILDTRQHWFEMFRSILPELATTLAVVILVTTTLLKWTQNSNFAWAYLLVLIPLFSLARDVLIWRNHQYIVTSRRVIQIFGVFSKNVTDSSLEKVNDVKMVQSFWGRMFGFGDIEILTASEMGINRFTHIDRPIQFKTAMLNAKQNIESPLKEPLVHTEADLPAALLQLTALREKNMLDEMEFQKIKNRLISRIS
jgi:uncharacterized membrane protein YdbT with pleckstrin-like domain